MARSRDGMLASWSAVTIAVTTHRWQLGERQDGAPGGWGWELRRVGSAGVVMAVLLGVWESVRGAYASSEAIVLHVVRGVVYTGRVVPTVPAGRSGAIGCTPHS